MALQITTNINVDFYDKEYLMINAKQYDDVSRWICITCYDNGKLFNISASQHTAYIRYRKADGHGVLNTCRINNKGEVLVELTEQMLSASGVCYVDLIIVEKGSAKINIDTGEVITIDGSPIISTMAFCVNVYEASFDNSLVESSDEFDALNDALKTANAEYQEVIQLAKSYAIGDANDIRENEDFDNSKYYSQLSKSYAIGGSGVRAGENTDNSKYYSEQANASASNADESESKALSYMDAAKSHKDNAEIAQSKSETAQSKAETAQSAAEAAEAAAAISEDNAKASEQAAANSATNAHTSEVNASTSESNASTSEANALAYADIAKSYTVGGTGVRENEDVDNAKYYFELSKDIVNSIDVKIATVDETKEYLGI